MTKHKLLFNLLNKRKEFDVAKQEYISSVKEFWNDSIKNVQINFKGNVMYVTFDSIPVKSDSFYVLQSKFDEVLSKFCDEFGVSAPTISVHQPVVEVIYFKYKCIKILE